MLPSSNTAMTPAHTWNVLGPIATTDQIVVYFDTRSSARLMVKITRCRAWVTRERATGTEIYLCSCEWSDDEHQGNDVKYFFHIF